MPWKMLKQSAEKTEIMMVVHMNKQGKAHPKKSKSTKKSKTHKTKTKKTSKSKVPKTKAKTKVKPKVKPKPKPKKKGTPSFMMRGKDAKAALKHEQQKADLAQEEAGKAWRFFIGKHFYNEDFPITFLDGDLDEDGLLDIPYFYEHGIYINGGWTQIRCVAEEESCPACDAGEKVSLVGAMTIIDHTPYESKKDEKVYVDRQKLFIPKRTTIQLLTKIAKKRGGLTGCRFDVSRTGKNDANVGNNFEFDEKYTAKQLKKLFGKESKPLDYNEEIVYRDREALLKMGVGTANDSIGGESEPSDEELEDEV